MRSDMSTLECRYTSVDALSRRCVEFLILLLFLGALGGGSRPALADHLVIPRAGGLEVIDLAVSRSTTTLQMPGRNGSWVAATRDSTVLAASNGEGDVRFWNLPNFSEASRFEEPLLEGATEFAFSWNGDRLLFISPRLRALVVWSLVSSDVESVWPIPGSDPTGLSVGPDSLVVWQNDGCVVLDPQSGGLELQIRLGTTVQAATVDGPLFYFSTAAAPGLARFAQASGAELEPRVGGAVYRALASREKHALYAYSDRDGRLEAWRPDGSRLLWQSPAPVGADVLLVSADGDWLYLLDTDSGVLTVLSSERGSELGRLALSGSAGTPVYLVTP